MKFSATLFLAACLSLGLAGAAQAQSNPSADQIINSLRPDGAMVGTTRGIHPVAPPSAAAPMPQTADKAARLPTHRVMPPPAQAATATTGNESPSVNLNIQFATGSARLLPEAVRALDQLGRALSSPALASYKFRIEGHTDTAGDRQANQVLSEQRAHAVVAYLTDRAHVDPSRLTAVGLGEQNLLVPTAEGIAESRNRRVLVVNTGS